MIVISQLQVLQIKKKNMMTSMFVKKIAMFFLPQHYPLWFESQTYFLLDLQDHSDK